ncbi:ABC transporter ATP-binding protein [Rhodospirillaceae bacterium SYSU D60014]|uniref:ABC transporter ATP-binding protein n=1 Tax=Virgifigura deserti TaxID=2268457 RepID=UPI000E661B80
MTGQMLTIEKLNSFYGRAHILFDVALEAARGEVVALLGRNGAGKSTTFRSIMGLVESRRGHIAFAGQDISRRPPHEIARLGLGYVPEDRRIFTDLTVMENLEVGRQPPRREGASWTPERLFALFPNLAEMRDRPGGRMSGGEQQMLTIARTLMGNPAMILLDEPSEGLAPRIIEMMAHAILELKKEGVTVILSEQNLHFASVVSDRAYVIEKGRIRYQGTMKELAADEDVRRAYLTL